MKLGIDKEFTVKDEPDKDGYLRITIDTICGFEESIRINKEEAERIIQHLTNLFKL